MVRMPKQAAPLVHEVMVCTLLMMEAMGEVVCTLLMLWERMGGE